MIGRNAAAILFFTLLTLAPAIAEAQSASPADVKGAPWFVVGGASTTLLADCSDCETAGHYRHAGSFVANAGASLNKRADLGAEVLWIPSTTVTGEKIRTTFVIAVAQVRPWSTKGFFVKGGVGMAFVRNWVVDLSGGGDPTPPFTSKAFGLGLGAGWEWKIDRRFGFQAFGTQHVAALGDLQTNQQRVENVVGNFWSVGAGIVIR